MTPLKANRLVNPADTGNRPLSDCAISATGTRVQRQGDGFILVVLSVRPAGDRGIAGYQRGHKQHRRVERAQVRAATAQRHHINCTIRAFLRLEPPRLVTSVRWRAEGGHQPERRPAVSGPSVLYPLLHAGGTCVSPIRY